MRRRVVLTGIGIISPIGLGIEEFWKNCLEANTVVTPIPQQWYSYYDYTSSIWAPLPSIDFASYGIRRTESLQLDHVQLITLSVVKEALDNAELTYVLKDEKKNIYALESIEPNRCGVYIGTGIGGVTTLLSAHGNHVFSSIKKLNMTIRSHMKTDQEDRLRTLDDIEQRMIMPARFNPFVVAMTMPNACSAVIGIKYSITGPNVTYASACASGTVALGKAFRAIQLGALDVAIAGGVEYLADDYGSVFRGFDVAQTLVKNGDDAERANRPFDRNRSGFLFSAGGGGMFVLEALEHARKREAHIFAEITAFAETFDAYSMMSIRPDGVEVQRMIEAALRQANLASDEIDYVNAHGTGTVLNDEAEAAVIARIFGDNVLINSTKSLIGHTIGASGAIEAAVTALSIYHKTTHICKNLEDPVKDLNFVRVSGEYPIRRALTQSFAFGGHNAALILEECRP